MDAQHNSRSDDAGVADCLQLLSEIPTKQAGPMCAPDVETGLLHALRREPVASIGRYLVHTDFSDPDRTVVFVQDCTGSVEHKYIFAHTDEHTYIVAMPMPWILLHKHILARVLPAARDHVSCSGGGYVGISPNCALCVDRLSTDFGAGDHVVAKAAFEKAVRQTASGQA